MPEIERIRAGSPDQLWETYVLGRKPVILTHLLDDFPHTTVAQVVAGFRDVVATELAPMTPGATGTTLGEWLDHASAGVHVPKAPGQSAYSAPTHDLPLAYARQARQLYATVDRLQTPIDRRIEELGRGPVAPGSALMFYGYLETTTCHTDGWITQNLTAHLAGAKEWFLAPPQAIAPLGPHGAAILMDPMKLAPAQRRALADAIGGYSFTVQPGETLYWPHQWLHGTYYPEPSISFVLHFGRDLHSMFVSREVHRCFLRHAILEQLYPAARIEARHRSEFLAIHDVCKHDHASPRARLSAVEEVLRTVYDRLYPDQPLDRLAFDLPAIRDLEDQAGLRFYDPEHGFLQRGRDAWTEITQQPLFDWWRR
jgi:Cupin-like domain